MIVTEYKKRSDKNLQTLKDLENLENNLTYFKCDKLSSYLK